MKSQVVKRSIVIDGRKTSISIEDKFWIALKDLAKERGNSLSTMVSQIKVGREANSNLSSAIRVFIVRHLRSRIEHLQAVQNAPAAYETSGGTMPAQAGRIP